MTPKSRWLILTFAVLGLGFASYSSFVHYKLLTDPTYVSPCDLSATFNCTQAYLSRFGALFGVPVALLGAAWFALVALVAAFARPDAPGTPPASPAGSYIFGLATVGLAVVLYLGYASYVVLHKVCLLCTGTYVSVIAIFIISGLTASVAMTRLPMRLGRDLVAVMRQPVTLIIALIYIVGAASGVAWFPREMRAPAQSAVPAPPPPADEQARFETAWNAQPRVDLGLGGNGAKVVIVKFNDWLCPACHAYAVAYQPLLEKFAKEQPGAVKLVLKDWPWNPSCNATLTPPPQPTGHEGSCDAAVAVRLARDRGKDGPMIDWLLENQQRLFDLGASGKGAEAQHDIRAKAAELLGVTDFDRAAAPKLVEMKKDVADGAALHIDSTPTFFVNGVRIPNRENLPPPYMEMAIRIELAKSGGK